MTPRILVVDDEESLCEFLSIMLRKDRYEVDVTLSGTKALEMISEKNYDIVITDIQMPESVSGLELLHYINENFTNTLVILMTAFASLESAIDAVNKGAFAYIQKPFRIEELKASLKKAVDHLSLKQENILLKKQLKSVHTAREIIGRSDPMKKIFQMIDRVADSDSTILIRGESGTGKELIAREIHYRSQRTDRSFVSINCGALTETLLESELFGHVKGAFTGASHDKKGLFAEANGGTFFLDEIGETSASTQVKLLRVLQEREFMPVGSTKTQSIDVRIIAATNADLEEMVNLGKFRPDLFYRLSVIPLFMPSLRERKDDIPLLCDHFIKKFCGDKPIALSKEALTALNNYDWPGNVRELENLVEQAIVLTAGKTIHLEDLPDKIRTPRQDHLGDLKEPLNPTLEELEKAYIYWILSQNEWNKADTAKLLAIDPSTLNRKIQKYGLKRPA